MQQKIISENNEDIERNTDQTTEDTNIIILNVQNYFDKILILYMFLNQYLILTLKCTGF